LTSTGGGLDRSLPGRSAAEHHAGGKWPCDRIGHKPAAPRECRSPMKAGVLAPTPLTVAPDDRQAFSAGERLPVAFGSVEQGKAMHAALSPKVEGTLYRKSLPDDLSQGGSIAR
jgi:hypothetical protein